MRAKRTTILMLGLCVGAIAVTFYGLGGIDGEALREAIARFGPVAPLVYVATYAIVTLLVLPSTALNLLGGALFGTLWGTVWTAVAAIAAAIVAFALSRHWARPSFERRLDGRWQAMDAEFRRDGLSYLLALRLLPILPYGLVNFTAGLTSISWRDYCLATALGTVPGILPFVMLGASGATVADRGEVWPVLAALGAIALLLLGGVGYRRSRSRRGPLP